MQIQVLYCARSAPDRNWSAGSLSAYEEILPGRTAHWLGASAHFNPGILRILERESSDLFVLSDYSAPTTQLAMRYLTWRKKPWVFWGEVPGLRQRGLLGHLARHRLQRPIGQGAKAIAATGSQAVDVYRAIFPRIRVFNIPYFCDLTDFKAAAAAKQIQRKAIVALFSGQLIERKGVDLLIRAFTQISDQVPELCLQLLGTGPAAGILKGMIPLELQGRVQFLGFQQPSALPTIFAAADIFVLPSRHDGWGVVVNEALGSGLPIILSDRVGARDLVEDGSNGFVTSAGDVDELANALHKLAMSSDLRRSFSRSSSERAARWDLAEGVRRWTDLCDQVLSS
jgi:glycosyltransferase involved in cell wall biosynthesis